METVIGVRELKHRLSYYLHLVVSELAFVEFQSAVACRRRDAQLTARQAAGLVVRIRKEWPDFARVEVSREVIERAADLVGKHALRAFDAVQLASALLVAAGAPEPLRFGAADARLRVVARAEGLTLAE